MSDILILAPGSNDRKTIQVRDTSKKLTHRYSRVILNLGTLDRQLDQGSYSRSMKRRMSSDYKVNQN